MVKFLFFITSLFTFNFNENYKFVSTESEDLSEVIFFHDNVYIKKIKEEQFFLYLKGYQYDLEGEYFNCYLVNDGLFLFKYQNNSLFIQKYYFDGTFDNEELIYNGKIEGEIEIIEVDDILYCAFTSNDKNKNIEILKINYQNLYVEDFYYGKNRNEKFISIKYLNNYLYLVVQKDQITESEFGNGGVDDCYVIAKVSTSDMNVEEYITLNQTNNFKDFKIIDNFIYCAFEDKLYLFNDKLELLNTLLLNSCFDVLVGIKNILIFNLDNIIIYDTLSLVKKEIINLDSQIKNYKEFTNVLYCEYQDNYYLFDLVDLSGIKNYKYYNYQYQENIDEKLKNVYSLFGKCQFKEKEYLEYHQRNVYGLYHIDTFYLTNGGIEFINEIEEEILLEVNITNGMIYPNGYRIIFNGEGYLDGNLILSNHAVINDGNHKLLIKGVNEEKEFDFYVSNKQYQFIDRYNDYEAKNIKINENFIISFEVNDNIEIKNINCLGGVIKDYSLNNNQLDIYFYGFDDVGKYDVIINSIDYKNNYYEDTIYLNKVIYLNVYNNSITSYESVINEDCSCEFEYLDYLNQARYIEYHFINEVNEYLYKFPIGNQKIDIKGLKNGKYQMIVSLVYNSNKVLGDGLDRFKIYDMIIDVDNDLEIGEINVITNENGHYKLLFKLNNNFKTNNLLELKKDNNIIYNSNNFKKESLISYCAIFFVVFIVLGMCIRYLYKKKENKKI